MDFELDPPHGVGPLRIGMARAAADPLRGGCYYAGRMGVKPVTYSLDLDIGEVADGHHLIVRSISLTGKNLLFDCAFVPEPADEAEVWPNMAYGADVSPPGWNQAWSEGEVYERPVPEARYAWFDFFRPDYDVEFYGLLYPPPGSDYLRNRIARLTFDLRTGEAQIEK